MIAEVVEKGDATFTIKYTAENGQEAMIVSMMSMATDHTATINATSTYVHVGGAMIPILKALSEKFPKGKK